MAAAETVEVEVVEVFDLISLMLGVNLVDSEHWVGGILEFARLWS